MLNDQNEVDDSAEEMSQEFNKSFSSILTKEMSGKTVWVSKENGNKLCDINITEKNVSEKLDRLRDDNLAPRFLHSIKQKLAPRLVILCKKVLNDKTVPRDWKDANVVPIFKRGWRDASTNFRPVSQV